MTCQPDSLDGSLTHSAHLPQTSLFPLYSPNLISTQLHLPKAKVHPACSPQPNTERATLIKLCDTCWIATLPQTSAPTLQSSTLTLPPVYGLPIDRNLHLFGIRDWAIWPLISQTTGEQQYPSKAVELARWWREGMDKRCWVGMYAANRSILLANSLVHMHLGRGSFLTYLLRHYSFSSMTDWRRPPYPVHTADYATYVQIITWFLDTPSPEAPFSVHRMALAGKELGKEVGQWFGPSTAAGAIKYVHILPCFSFQQC